jgi:hypothetical protein
MSTTLSSSVLLFSQNKSDHRSYIESTEYRIRHRMETYGSPMATIGPTSRDHAPRETLVVLTIRPVL